MKRFDGVIEGVRYLPTGMVDVVRLYERRGATFSDWLLWTRAELVERLKAGKKVAIGSRKLLVASTFEVKGQVRLLRGHSGEVLTTHGEAGERDLLDGAPLF